MIKYQQPSVSGEVTGLTNSYQNVVTIPVTTSDSPLLTGQSARFECSFYATDTSNGNICVGVRNSVIKGGSPIVEEGNDTWSLGTATLTFAGCVDANGDWTFRVKNGANSNPIDLHVEVVEHRFNP